MSQVGHSTDTLNGGKINQVSFPGSETGKSLVELTADVEVTCELSSIRLLLTAFADTTAVASTANAVVYSRMQLSAFADSVSLTNANGRTNARVLLDPATASAQVASTGRMLFSLAASAACSATVAPVSAYPRATRSASTSPTASTSAFAYTYLYRTGFTSGVALTSAGTLRKRNVPAETVASAVATALSTFRMRPSASTSASASGISATRVNIWRGATTNATASAASVLLVKKLVTPLDAAIAQALTGTIFANQRLRVITGVTAEAVGSVSVLLKFRVAAAVEARAVAASGAEDFAVAAPAPVERLMYVPASDRRMEVTL